MAHLFIQQLKLAILVLSLILT